MQMNKAKAFAFASGCAFASVIAYAHYLTLPSYEDTHPWDTATAEDPREDSGTVGNGHPQSGNVEDNRSQSTMLDYLDVRSRERYVNDHRYGRLPGQDERERMFDSPQ